MFPRQPSASVFSLAPFLLSCTASTLCSLWTLFLHLSISTNQGCCITEHGDSTGLCMPFISTGASRSSWSSLNSLTGKNHVTTTMPRLHMPIDHHLDWIQTLKEGESGMVSSYSAVLGWALSGRESSSTVRLHSDDSSVLNTHNLSLLCKASLCAAECVSSST